MQSNEFVTKFLDDNVPCSQGLGQDRHLYALFCIWKRYYSDESLGETSDSDDENTLSDTRDPVKDVSLREIPPIFADAGWDKLNNTIISTSNCGNPSLKLFGFGPVSPNGFGLGYIIKDNSITICASSKHRQTQRFLDTLNSSFLEMEHTYVESLKPDDEASFGTEIANKLNDLRVGRGRRARPAIIRLLGGYDSFEVDSNSDLIKSREQSPEPPFARQRVFTNRDIGKKLRLAEY
ncbi:hypothetical protein KL912_001113 [Ogataea haglerorum]|nr:hypothetical protein KL912_001113 [Ogataea haglerorum]